MLTRDLWAPWVGHGFELESAEGYRLPLVLVECAPLPMRSDPSGARAPFSLLFESPVLPHWPQGNYRLHHAQAACEVLFLVPLGPAPRTGRMRYQAIFN